MIWISIVVTFWCVVGIAVLILDVRQRVRDRKERRIIDSILRIEERQRENHRGPKGKAGTGY